MPSIRRCHPIAWAIITPLIVFASPDPAWAQSAEEHNVETIESAELGPYRPDHRPDIAEVQQLIRQQVNAFRSEQELPKTKANENLQKAARKFAEYMARTDRYGHTADGNRPAQRAKEAGYAYCIVLENIAYQFRTTGFPTKELAERLVQGWKDSPPHRKNMLDPDVTETGVGIAHSEKTGAYYAVQMFGRPESAAIEFQLENSSGGDVSYRVGKKQFTLPDRYTRTHRVCRPPDLTLSTETEDDGSKGKSVKPSSGQRFVIDRNAAGKLTIEPQASRPASQ